MQTSFATEREVVELLDREFTSLVNSLRRLTTSVTTDLLYRRPPTITIGENILKSTGVIEQSFGGITTNLWDDPFEWTLPETLSTPDLVLEYIAEVEGTRQRAFATFNDDATLLKLISVPSGDQIQLLGLLMQTLVRASDYRGRALATFKMLSDVNASRFII